MTMTTALIIYVIVVYVIPVIVVLTDTIRKIVESGTLKLFRTFGRLIFAFIPLANVVFTVILVAEYLQAHPIRDPVLWERKQKRQLDDD